MIGSILLFLVVLSVLILVHEFGHFFSAKRFGVWVEEFGLGYPPRAIGKKIGDTIYSLNWLPFGGFVRLHGEQTEEGVTKPDKAFVNKSKGARAVIISAGVIMNFLLAIVLFSITYSITGIPRQTDNVNVIEVAEGSPAEVAGIVPGEVLRQIDGKEIASVEDFQLMLADYYDEEVEVVVETPIDEYSETRSVVIVPRGTPPEGEGSLGVVIGSTETYFPPLWQRPFYGAFYGTKEAILWGKMIIVGMFTMFSRLAGGEIPKDIAGPVGIYAITTQAAKFGAIALINFVGIFSINLAILNLLPFPPLDGWRLLMIGVEAVIRRKVMPKFEQWVQTVGMIILILLLVLVTFNDVRRLVKTKSIEGYLENVIEEATP